MNSIAKQLVVEHVYITDIDNPIIKKGTKVLLKYIFNFPTTGKVFITLQDLENFNMDKRGNPEAIITTLEYKVGFLLEIL